MSGISYGWKWFYYINPLSWALQSITINEYSSPSYDFSYCLTPDCSKSARYGDVVLQSRGTTTDVNYIWYGFGVCVAEYFFLVFLTILALQYLRTEPSPPPPIIVPFVEIEYENVNENENENENENININENENDYIRDKKELNIISEEKKMAKEEGEGKREGKDRGIYNENILALDLDVSGQAGTSFKDWTVRSRAESKLGRSPRSVKESYVAMTSSKSAKQRIIQEIPFEPISFSFKDIWYTVTLPDKEELDLLKGVSGYFEPGTLTALMGSSGAGKTTLLDVLSGRKNTGTVKGGMFVNGKPKEEHSFRRSMGYVEQFDSLSPMETARDVIEFSAALRLPRGTTTEERQSWVDSVLVMLELLPLENTLVGTESTGGMSFEQKKRVSIGVELAANPAILFLDEPTTGLDSRAAQVVIRNIKRVAASGRSIVCTIHQPSAIIFSSFDSLLLLQRGGQTVFFGNLGENCSGLINHFQSAPNVPSIGHNVNPATWMLEVIGAGTSSSQIKIDFSLYYKDSELCSLNTAYTDALCISSQGGSRDEMEFQGPGTKSGIIKNRGVVEDSKYNTSLSEQLTWLFKRASRSYWRSPSYNVTRFAINVVIALIFASAYSDQTYNTDVNAVSRSAVIYITVFFCGVVGMQNVLPVAFADRL